MKRFILFFLILAFSFTIAPANLLAQDEDYSDYEETGDDYDDYEEDDYEEDDYEDENYEEDDEEDDEEVDEESESEPQPVEEQGPKSTDKNSAKLIEAHLKSLGGLDKIKGIKTLKMKGTIKEASDRYTIYWYRKYPNKYRVETHSQHLGKKFLSVAAYDGKEAWQQEIAPEKGLPEIMDKKKARDFIREADFYGPLVDWKKKGNNFSYEGKAKVNKTSTHLIKGKIKDGPVIWYYLDAKTFFLRKCGFKEDFNGTLVDADYYVADMKKVKGVWLDKTLDYQVNGKTYKKINREKIAANVRIDNAMFSIPRIKEVWLKQN